MYKVYILKNDKTGRHYIGSSSDLSRRLVEHNRGQTKSTNISGNWYVIYEEEYATSLEAKRREKEIKSYKGGNAFKKLITRE